MSDYITMSASSTPVDCSQQELRQQIVTVVVHVNHNYNCVRRYYTFVNRQASRQYYFPVRVVFDVSVNYSVYHYHRYD